MQSQQKRVKWSRGETAEALEERTDTGVTQASLELMENCMPDIYGNISRRPALKVLQGDNCEFDYDEHAQFIPFYITENDIILICVHYTGRTEFIRVKNDEMVAYKVINGVNDPQPHTRGVISNEGGTLTYGYKAVSYAQQNNYMLIADANNVYKIQVYNFETNNNSFDISCDLWQFSAGWYAPDGTRTASVNSSQVTGLNFQANSIANYIFTEPNGQTVVYSSIKTGLTSTGFSHIWAGTTTTYYLHGGGNTGSITIDTNSANNIGSFTMTNGVTYSHDQTLTTYSFNTTQHGVPVVKHGYAKIWFTDNSATLGMAGSYSGNTINVTNQFTISPSTISQYIPVGSIVQFPNNGAYMRVEGYDSDGTHQIIFGALLTPVADDNANDTSVNVEYGFVSMQPTNWYISGTYPHPTKLLFLDQRLWAGSWSSSETQQYSITIGSQTARYTDFKNDYNQDNEAITLEVLTNFKEKIVHLIDYNGLKIMTDSYEYAYDGKIVKQSGNGSLENCEPLVFESLCLYADSTGNQIKAMQYEFTNNIFNSSSINTLAPKDLIWYPLFMAAFEDKTYSTGKHLFVVNEDSDQHPRVAVCNFVPNNQANIWSRWEFPKTQIYNSIYYPLIQSIVQTKSKPFFMVVMKYGDSYMGNIIIPAILDFESDADFLSPLHTNGGHNYFAPRYVTSPVYFRTSLINTTVNIYADGIFQFQTTVDNTGEITDDLSGLTNVTVGLPINAKIVSHPIDVGGKTKSVMKRIGKAQMSVHDTPAGAITINGKTGYMNPRTDHICFYGVTGMKDEIKYTITNNNGAMFHLESLLMNIEYGTLDS